MQLRLARDIARAAVAAVLVAAAPIGLSTIAAPALAAGAQVKASAPGYYRMMLGDFEITALSDGTVDLHTEQLLTGATPARLRRMLGRAYLKDPVETSVNAYPINTGSRLVLVDAGAATLFGPTLDKLMANLKASGYQPEQVDEVYVTHMHPDHVGGLMDGDWLAFPNAVVRAARRGDYVAGSHLSFPGIGRLRADGKGYAWIAAHYTVLR